MVQKNLPTNEVLFVHVATSWTGSPPGGTTVLGRIGCRGVNTKRQKSEGTQESITSQDRRAAIETPSPVHRNGAGGHRQKAGATEAYRDTPSYPNPGHGTARRGRGRELEPVETRGAHHRFTRAV